jgi:hypothetical protein
MAKHLDILVATHDPAMIGQAVLAARKRTHLSLGFAVGADDRAVRERQYDAALISIPFPAYCGSVPYVGDAFQFGRNLRVNGVDSAYIEGTCCTSRNSDDLRQELALLQSKDKTLRHGKILQNEGTEWAWTAAFDAAILLAHARGMDENERKRIGYFLQWEAEGDGGRLRSHLSNIDSIYINASNAGISIGELPWHADAYRTCISKKPFSRRTSWNKEKGQLESPDPNDMERYTREVQKELKRYDKALAWIKSTLKEYRR